MITIIITIISVFLSCLICILLTRKFYNNVLNKAKFDVQNYYEKQIDDILVIVKQQIKTSEELQRKTIILTNIYDDKNQNIEQQQGENKLNE